MDTIKGIISNEEYDRLLKIAQNATFGSVPLDALDAEDLMVIIALREEDLARRAGMGNTMLAIIDVLKK